MFLSTGHFKYSILVSNWLVLEVGPSEGQFVSTFLVCVVNAQSSSEKFNIIINCRVNFDTSDLLTSKLFLLD